MERFTALTTLSIALLVSGCLPYLYTEREPALVVGIDFDQTLDVAEAEFTNDDESAFDVLTLWSIRDQRIEVDHAERIAAIYFDHIERIDRENQRGRGFAVWHLTWAISNMYRFGDEGVQHALEEAYFDARQRADRLDRKSARRHVNGEQIYSGYAHAGGRSYARKHVVVPGNDEYLQSYEEYLERERD